MDGGKSTAQLLREVRNPADLHALPHEVVQDIRCDHFFPVSVWADLERIFRERGITVDALVRAEAIDAIHRAWSLDQDDQMLCECPRCPECGGLIE